MMPRPWLLLCTAALLSACATYPANPPLARYDPDAGYRFNNLSATDNTDSLFVILSFSGGGTRAGALSYGVMEKLRDTVIRVDGVPRRLLDEVDVISSVSGGSFTAAYYGLFGEEIFATYEQAFLYRDIQGQLFAELMSPRNWFRLASPTYGRIEVAAELYDREIFAGKTFDTLIERQRRPFIMLNATDISLGSQFIFHQAQFDLLCSDLGGVKVARAVAASSDFPLAFSPLAINNYAGSCSFREPPWIGQAEKDLLSNPRRFRRAQQARSYLDAARRPYIHLLDGGVSDNIGLRGPLTAIRANDWQWNIMNRVNRGLIDRIVVITVDAKTLPSTRFDRSASPPGAIPVLETISTVPMENYSFDTVQQLRDIFRQWNRDQEVVSACRDILHDNCPGAGLPFPPARRVQLYNIYIGFERIADAERRSYFQHMATSFHLPAQQVDDLRAIAGTLLDESEEFQRLRRDMAD
ncbi:MAG: patatin-like phospholipase family protein [Elusimicrobiales bacterium]|nr:patatin-like phospholipase family protein [Elusimicrobiales bacterium]